MLPLTHYIHYRFLPRADGHFGVLPPQGSFVTVRSCVVVAVVVLPFALFVRVTVVALGVAVTRVTLPLTYDTGVAAVTVLVDVEPTKTTSVSVAVTVVVVTAAEVTMIVVLGIPEQSISSGAATACPRGRLKRRLRLTPAAEGLPRHVIVAVVTEWIVWVRVLTAGVMVIVVVIVACLAVTVEVWPADVSTRVVVGVTVAIVTSVVVELTARRRFYVR